ncbi:MAG TPA: SoxR reducing system RseC family protein [Deltaproteobacteria bacterium]|nr:SoxR reducing system RseC family protein [Deltaproteobacteria bacterium]HOI08282.1 SoxR reducing system RseC family protein [Deltaproteobacteria bacterium]
MVSVCGTVQSVSEAGVQVTIERTMACQGCQSTNVCHGFVKRRMDLTLPVPPVPVSVGDTVLVAMDDSSVVKASAMAFLIPLIAILAGLFLARLVSPDVAVQTIGALLAFLTSLIIVRYMGKRIEAPRILEVVHEK